MAIITNHLKPIIVIALITLQLFIFSCASNYISYININPVTSFSKSKIKDLKTAKISVLSINNDINNNIVGYKIKQNLFYSKNSNLIYSTSNILELVDKSFQNWLIKNKVKITKAKNYQKKIIVKLGYISIYPLIDNNYIFKPFLRAAIKIEIYDSKNHILYDHWHFYNKSFSSYKATILERNLNYSLKEFIKEIIININPYMSK
ncbi:MAG: hypothetical protein CMP18_02290 [Rickettsiales bacterium]|nr:hypothetical protein [Rickettsiales bacterium]